MSISNRPRAANNRTNANSPTRITFPNPFPITHPALKAGPKMLFQSWRRLPPKSSLLLFMVPDSLYKLGTATAFGLFTFVPMDAGAGEVGLMTCGCPQKVHFGDDCFGLGHDYLLEVLNYTTKIP